MNLPRPRISFFALFFILLLLPPLPASARITPAPGERPIVVGGDSNYPPYEFLDEEGNPSGYNVELTRAIAEVMGMEVEIRLGPWSEMRRALSSGEVDVLQGMAYLEERIGEVDYSVPHTVVHQSIWNRKGEEPIESVEEMRGKEVIVMKESVNHDFMMKQDVGATLIPIDSLAAALSLLASGKHDCALVAKLPGQYLLKGELSFAAIEPVARPITAQKYGYAVKKGNTEMLARFSAGLVLLKKSGRYQQIHNRWLGVIEPPGVPWVRIVRYGAMVILPLLLVLGGTVIWSRTLSRKVASRTEDLQREVAERKRVIEELEVRQRQLIQADKMTSLGILVSGVAHEINNPNGLILLNLPLLLKAYGDAEPILEDHFRQHGDFRLGWLKYSRMRREIPQMFDEMQDGARRIKRIVDDLKDFARRDDSDFAPVRVNEAVAAAIRLVDASLRKATDRFTVEYGETLPEIRGSQQRIEQVVINLLLNACQALPDKSRGIFVRTSFDRQGGRVLLEVRDEGVGLDGEELSHLTDPFFTTKRETGGTGLGLSVSAGIVKEHGGELAFSSPPGEGMTVTLALPVPKENP